MSAQVGVLAVVAVGTSAAAIIDHRITVEVDGTSIQVTSFAGSVAGVLADAGVSVGEHDTAFPSVASAVPSSGLIVVRHARQLEVEIDGATSTVWTTAESVGEAVDTLGVRDGAVRTSASRSEPLGRDVLRISTAKTVHVSIDGTVVDTTTAAQSVREALAGLGVVLNEGDLVSAPLDSIVADGMVVAVTRAATGTATVTEVVPFEVQQVDDPSQPVGKTTVKTKGVVGQRVTTYSVDAVGGASLGQQVVASAVTVAPVAQVELVGSMTVPDVPAVTPGSAQEIAKQMLTDRGWGDDEFACLVSLWNRESGWSVTAGNKSSGAYGIPQALPGSKMASAGADWQTSASTQITWGLGYIAGRYGTPCGAWGSFLKQNWY